MKPLLLTLSFALLCPVFTIEAADRITRSDVETLIAQTDAASQKRDVTAIGNYLSDNFSKYIELPMEEWDSAFRIDKDKYLSLITEGWKHTVSYSYDRTDTVINIAMDGQSADSNSTITEIFILKGKKITSKVREYAHYELENGRLLITRIEGLKLVGDTTPEAMLFSKQE